MDPLSSQAITIHEITRSNTKGLSYDKENKPPFYDHPITRDEI